MINPTTQKVQETSKHPIFVTWVVWVFLKVLKIILLIIIIIIISTYKHNLIHNAQKYSSDTKQRLQKREVQTRGSSRHPLASQHTSLQRVFNPPSLFFFSKYLLISLLSFILTHAHFCKFMSIPFFQQIFASFCCHNSLFCSANSNNLQHTLVLLPSSYFYTAEYLQRAMKKFLPPKKSTF